MLKRIHQAHLGIVKCKQRAREILFWAGMGTEIEEMVSKCPMCNENRNSNAKQPLIPHEIPQGAQALICISVVCFSVYLFYECLYIAF